MATHTRTHTHSNTHSTLSLSSAGEVSVSLLFYYFYVSQRLNSIHLITASVGVSDVVVYDCVLKLLLRPRHNLEPSVVNLFIELEAEELRRYTGVFQTSRRQIPVSAPLQVMAGCPAACECPAEAPACPPGVSSVLDGCGCCKVCAAQLNQDCSSARPCDHHKGLECNYGNDVTVAWGVCRGGSTEGGGGWT